jgi:hypothetical protein
MARRDRPNFRLGEKFFHENRNANVCELGEIDSRLTSPDVRLPI